MKTTQYIDKNAPMLHFFDQIYIINLETRTDRLAEIKAEFEKIGIDISHPNIQVFKAIKPLECEGWPSIGTKGCYLSNVGVLKDAKLHGYARILILEDDVNFNENFNTLMQNCIQQLNNVAWDMFYGGYRVNALGQLAISSHLISESNGQSLYASPCDIDVECCHFVALNQTTAACMVDYLENMMQRPMGHSNGGRMHVDGAYSWFRKEHPHIKTLLAVPEVCYQRSSRTDIHDLKWFDTLPIVKNAANTVRKIKNQLFAV